MTEKEIINKIKEERQRQHLSAAAVAAMTGISSRTIQRIEAGVNSGKFTDIINICRTLGLDLSFPVKNPLTDDELKEVVINQAREINRLTNVVKELRGYK